MNTSWDGREYLAIGLTSITAFGMQHLRVGSAQTVKHGSNYVIMTISCSDGQYLNYTRGRDCFFRFSQYLLRIATIHFAKTPSLTVFIGQTARPDSRYYNTYRFLKKKLPA